MPTAPKAFAIALWVLLASCVRAELDSAFYIWQFDWTEEVREAVRESEAPERSFMVLTSEWSLNASGQLQRREANVDWSVLSGDIVPVVRMNVSLVPWVDTQCDALATALREHESALRSTALEQGVSLGPLQIDYDCPTARLPAYRRLLQSYNRPVTITTLPTWLSSGAFAPLVRETTSYVLQLHSLEPPRSPNELGTIFTRTPNTFIKQASAIGVPFHVALPTYGYAYYFDEAGTFKRLSAEDTDSPRQPRTTRRTLMSDPVRVGATVRDVTSSPPPHCRGIAWFRMPVDGDQLNWHRTTLAAVMHGETPHLDIRAELKESNGRWECWLSNHGNADPGERTAAFDVTWPKGYPLAMQSMGEYLMTRNGRRAQWTGPAPQVGSAPQLAGWMRFAKNLPAPSITTAHLTEDHLP